MFQMDMHWQSVCARQHCSNKQKCDFRSFLFIQNNVWLPHHKILIAENKTVEWLFKHLHSEAQHIWSTCKLGTQQMPAIILIYVNILDSIRKINCLLSLLKYFSILRWLQIFCLMHNHPVKINHFKLYFFWLTKVNIFIEKINKYAYKQSLATMNAKKFQLQI